jgi:hypothetical protein
MPKELGGVVLDTHRAAYLLRYIIRALDERNYIREYEQIYNAQNSPICLVSDIPRLDQVRIADHYSIYSTPYYAKKFVYAWIGTNRIPQDHPMVLEVLLR